MRAWGLLAAVAAGAFGLSFARPVGRADGQGPAGALRVAVVDVERVFEASAKKETLEAQFAREVEEKRTELKTLESELEKARGQLELVKEGSEEHSRLQKQIWSKAGELKFMEEEFSKSLKRRQAMALNQILTEIRGAIGEHARRLGFDLVLQRKLTIQEDLPSWESVIYARPELDITTAIIELMNGE